jgi:hypothetical protein
MKMKFILAEKSRGISDSDMCESTKIKYNVMDFFVPMRSLFVCRVSCQETFPFLSELCGDREEEYIDIPLILILSFLEADSRSRKQRWV